MELEGDSLSPRDSFTSVSSYGPPPSFSAQDTATHNLLNHTLQVSDELTFSGSPWSSGDNGDFERTGGPLSQVESGRSAQRSIRPSAFPSSLTWDSDSEKETLDEEELQHFSNPHGLAAHSPGSPSSGLRPDSEDHQAPEQLQHVPTETNLLSHVEERDQDKPNTHREKPKKGQHSSKELGDDRVWNISEKAELFQSKVTSKEGRKIEEEKEEEDLTGKDKEPERDVYTFPGDSDTESPPPAPWAHCTFIQRRKKKRALLRPFSGQGSWERTSTGAGKKARGASSRAKSLVPVKVSGGAYDFKEDLEKATEDLEKVEEEKGGEEGGGEGELGEEIFTCVECSIYFKKQVYLQDHMQEHSQSRPGAGRRERGVKGARFRCAECGWNLSNRLALADHNRRHQESRQKILEEIGKLSDSGKGETTQGEPSKVTKPASPVLEPYVAPVMTPTLVPFTEPVPAPFTEPDPAPFTEPDPATFTEPDPAPFTEPDPVPVPVRAPVKARAKTPVKAKVKGPANRRYLCLKCDFSTRTSQALANHAKTHNRKPTGLQRASPRFQPKLTPMEPPVSPGSASGLTSISLTCDQCAFQASSQTVLKEHQHVAHPAQTSICGEGPEEINRPGSRIDASSPPCSDKLSKPVSPPEGQSQSKASKSSSSWISAMKDSDTQPQPSNTATAPQRRELAFKTIGNTRANRRGKAGTELLRPNPRLDSGPPETDDAQRQRQSPDLAADMNQKETESLVGSKPLTRARSLRDDSSLKQQSLTASSSTEGKPVKEEEEDGETKVAFEKKSNKVFAAENDDEEEEENIRRFLEEGISDEDYEEIDEETGTLKSVERKCPYCPDRFHNGIGLANHVRGHLNRVGVSYNVRHFISPEEVNAIEKKFSYQKKKKKVANFDPDTFSVMRCEFCSAGFDTRAGLSSHARAHLRDFGITNWEVTVSPIHILRELFSSRPDLVLPTAPPRSPASDEEEEDLVLPTAPQSSPASDEEEDEDLETEEEEPGGGEGSEEATGATVSNLLPSSPSQPWKKDHSVGEPEGGEEEEQMPALDSLTSSPGRKGLFSLDPESPSPRDEADIKVSNLLKCEVCSAPFETRRGLSSHARSHLRQLGIGMSESSGAPIDLLYQITKERGLDGHFPPPLPLPPVAKKPLPVLPTPRKEERYQDTDMDEKPIPLSIPSPVASPPPSSLIRACSPSSVVRKAPISSLLPVSSPYAVWTISLEGRLMPHSTSVTLEVDPNKDIVCQLCGAWFETRKGLSSHARAHLRHFGVEYSESKGSPIDLLNQLIHTDDFKHRASALQPEGPQGLRGLTASLSFPKRSLLTTSSTPLLYKVTTMGGGSGSKATSSSASSMFGPPSKRPKSSKLQVFRLSGGELTPIPHSEPVKEIGCEFCGEYFENRKGLSSHARSHLRQMGITEWTVNGSPIDTLRELITRRGLPCALPLKPLKSPPPSPGPPRSPLSSPASPSLLSRLPFAFAHPPSHQSTVRKMGSAPPASPSLIVKLKPEPMQLEVTMPGAVGGAAAYSSEPLNCSWSSSDNMLPLNLVTAHEVEPTRDIRCEFCGEYFENRKGLSSHARSHLRQMGITEWTVNGSPIDTLRELMHKNGGTSSPAPGLKKETSQESSPTWEGLVGGLGYQSPKFSRKSPLNLLHSGSRLHKHGLGAVGLSSTPPAGKFFAVSLLGKRPMSEEGRPVERSPSHPQSFSPLPHDLSIKGKSSPDKNAGGHLGASCELCGFYFENRKALASHARAHLRQFGVTEWCVNGSPIETLSAWMRSRPHRVVEMHRSYMQGSNRSTSKKKSSSSLSPSSDSDLLPPMPSQKHSSSSQWAALGLAQARRVGRELTLASPRAAEGDAGLTPPSRPSHSSHSPSPARLSNTLPPHTQVARSELNVRLPRGFERRPLKHPSHSEGGERDSGTPKPPRTGTIPALVPKPPSTPLVKVVGKIYSLRCRFCEVEFQGPLSVQEDWIRHLQQHILNLNYNKPAPSTTDPPAQDHNPTPTSTSVPATTSSFTTTPAPTSTSPSIHTHTTAPTVPPPCSPSPPPMAESAPIVTATPMATASAESTLTPILIPTLSL
ncbi:protein Wiz [Oncorhynchus keta]|uniref:protein Wiz n=1 Tax=Oncorhynchus keta TaxID=8018 RepID=UPI00227BF58D|nr:protein Wiz [Oncorhynchus keta]